MVLTCFARMQAITIRDDIYVLSAGDRTDSHGYDIIAPVASSTRGRANSDHTYDVISDPPAPPLTGGAPINPFTNGRREEEREFVNPIYGDEDVKLDNIHTQGSKSVQAYNARSNMSDLPLSSVDRELDNPTYGEDVSPTVATESHDIENYIEMRSANRNMLIDANISCNSFEEREMGTGGKYEDPEYEVISSH